MESRVRRGQMWLYDFPPPDKRRPVVVISEQEVIDMLPSVTVAPVTSTIRGTAREVLVGAETGLAHTSAVNVDYIQAVPKRRLHHFLGTLDEETMEGVAHALKVATGCD